MASLRTRAIAAATIATAFTLVGCGSNESSDPSAVQQQSAVPDSGEVAPPSLDSPSSAPAGDGEAAAPDLPVSTVEGLTSVSDLAGIGTFGDAVDQWVSQDGISYGTVRIELGQILRGRAQTSGVTVLLTSNDIDFVVPDLSLIFLQELDGLDSDYDEKVQEARRQSGALFILVPGSSSVMPIDGVEVVAPGGLNGLEMSSADSSTAIDVETGSTLVASTTLRYRFALDSVLQIVSDPDIPPYTRPTTPSPSAADLEWLARLNSSCEAAKPAASKLRELLLEVAARGKWTSGESAEAIQLFTEARNGDALVATDAISDGLTDRAATAQASLDRAGELLLRSAQAEGDDLTALLVEFGTAVQEFQLAWVDLNVAGCKEFT